MAASLQWLAAALVATLGTGCLVGTAAAQDAGEDSLARFERSAGALRDDEALAHFGGNTPLRATMERNNRARLISSLSALAVAVIAREPHRRDEALQAAERAAPEVAAEVRARILAAFPDTAGAPPGYRQPASAAAVRSGASGSPPGRGRDYGSGGPALADPALAARRREQAEADYAARLEAWLIGAIAREPAALEAHLDEAAATMPEARARLVAAVGRAYPGYGERLAGTAPPPAQPDVATAEAPGAPVDDVPVIAAEESWDPLEPMNRLIDSVNQMIDFVVLRPIAKTYSTVAPDPVILAMRRFFQNLKQPVVVANDLLQLTFKDAATAAGRFGVNTTIGLLGFFDPATGMGLESHHADFGQTLHSYGLGPGPYLVLPLLGPSTARDGVGEVVDILLQPYGYFLPQEATLALTGTKAVVKREELLAPLDELKASSVDYYSGLRSAYYQRRAIQLNKGRGTLAAPDVETDRMFDEAR